MYQLNIATIMLCNNYKISVACTLAFIWGQLEFSWSGLGSTRSVRLSEACFCSWAKLGVCLASFSFSPQTSRLLQVCFYLRCKRASQFTHMTFMPVDVSHPLTSHRPKQVTCWPQSQERNILCISEERNCKVPWQKVWKLGGLKTWAHWGHLSQARWRDCFTASWNGLREVRTRAACMVVRPELTLRPWWSSPVDCGKPLVKEVILQNKLSILLERIMPCTFISQVRKRKRHKVSKDRWTHLGGNYKGDVELRSVLVNPFANLRALGLWVIMSCIMVRKGTENMLGKYLRYLEQSNVTQIYPFI